MASWGRFAEQAPEMAAAGRSALYRSGVGEAYLATMAGEGLPRINVVNVGIVTDRLLVFAQGHSAKATDLLTDGRYALHAFQDPVAPHEFLLRGRAHVVTEPDLRSEAVAVWPFSPAEGYPLFELDISHALFRERASPDDWQRRYTSWRDAT